MNQQQRQAQREQEVRELTETIRRLTARLEEIALEQEPVEQPRNQVPLGRPEPAQAPGAQNDDLQENELVEITNNYRGLRGARGYVVLTTPTWVDLRLEGTDQIVRRRKTNVRRV